MTIVEQTQGAAALAGRYRADQVGSLTRPPELKRAREAFRAGQLGREALREVEDRAILDALEQQRRIGFPIYSDGELRRDAWQTDLSDAVEGFVRDYPVVKQTLPDGRVVELEMHTKAVEARLRARRRISAGFLPFLKQHAPGPYKVTMPSPAMAARGGFKAGLTDRVYPTRAELLADLVAIYQEEMRALAAEGVPYVQLDEGFNAYVRDEWREGLMQEGRDPEQVLAQDIDAENACWDLLPATAVRATHLCRGSRTANRGAGTYEWLCERLLDRLHVDRFLFEYDSDAVGGFEPLRFLPKGKVVVLGLVTSKDPTLESQDTLLRKIEEASKYAPVEQLAISPQCGFGGSADNAFMTPDQQWKKLELLVETAHKVWG
jgi:methionine synthase II (cobalamin-independent)